MHTSTKTADQTINGVIVHERIQKMYKSMEFLGNLAHAVGTRLPIPPTH